MDNHGSPKRGNVIAEEAAEWIVVLADGDEQDKRAFADWLRLSPEHIKEYLAVAAIWGALPRHSPRPSAEELAAMAAGESDIVAMPGAAGNPKEQGPADSPRPPFELGQRWMGLAAAVLVAVTTSILLVMFPGLDPNVHVTATGEQTSVPLPDGSMVVLNTRSMMRVEFSETHRDVHLAEGEALFDVAMESDRPFRVITGKAIMQAVATQFNVRASDDEVVVTVVEGVVKLSAASRFDSGGTASEDMPGSSRPQQVRLKVGQQAQVGSGVDEVVVADAIVEDAIAWRQHRLVFDSLPLKQVIEEFNRYNEPPASITDSELESLPISGIFRSIDRRSFLQFLTRMGLAEAATADDGTIVIRRLPDNEPQQ